MASAPKRRNSKDLPPVFSELMNKLIEAAASFIQQFDRRESRMREIVKEFRRISEEVKEMQRDTDKVRTAGAVGGAGILVASILAAPFTGGLSLAVGGATALGGGATVVGANVTKIWSESGSAKKVERLGKEFMEKVEPMKENLEEIKETCEKLEDKAAEVQAGKTQADMEEFQKILRRMSELKEKSEGALFESLSVVQLMGELIALIVSIFRVTATPEEDEKLGNTIIKSADQCEKVVTEFDKMRDELEKFRGY